jgi:multidrug resistance efflux pump
MDTKTKNISSELIKEEKEILKEEKQILAEIKKEESAIKKLTRNVWALTILVILIIASLAGGLAYWKITSARIYTDQASISAPVVDLAPKSSGVLEEVFVNQGDLISENTVVARVGNELLKTKTAGVITSVQNNIGKIFNPGTSVVSMVDPDELRVVAHIDEDKGLSNIKIGQHAIFTADAFGSKEYNGIVDEISPSARQGDIVFNISDKRQIQQFDVKVRFDTSAYPELENGMSAKIWIYKK